MELTGSRVNRGCCGNPFLFMKGTFILSKNYLVLTKQNKELWIALVFRIATMFVMENDCLNTYGSDDSS